ncbi:MAG: 30S ribosomal protein S2, partial [Deltaproteobacteria bacterium]|nr:30S ribosomal protein S2 [Deltaproteobacteria bacterium]
RKEEIAVSEARKLNIPVVALTDTNCDPDGIDCIIPGNDDAIRAIKLIASQLADAVIEGKARRGEEEDAGVEELEAAMSTEDATPPKSPEAAAPAESTEATAPAESTEEAAPVESTEATAPAESTEEKPTE